MKAASKLQRTAASIFPGLHAPFPRSSQLFCPAVPRNPLCPHNKPFCITEAGLSGFLCTSKELIKTVEKLGAGYKDEQCSRKIITVPALEGLSLTGDKEEVT